MRRESKDDWKSRITIGPGVMGGKPVIKGPRVALEYVVGALAAGSSMSEVCEEYRITEEDLRAALAYAAYTLSEEVVHALPAR